MDERSMIFDISNLYIDTQIDLVNRFCKWLWEARVNGVHRKTMLIFEEAQLYTRYIKSRVAQELFRISMSGRNIGVRLCLISPRLNNVAAEFVFLSTQRYFGLTNEENVNRKIKAMYGSSVADACKTVRVGEFMYAGRGSRPERISVPLFESAVKPGILFRREEPAPEEKPRPPSKLSMIGYMALVAFFTFMFLLSVFG